MSESVWAQRRQPTRLPRPWDSPGKNTGVGCYFLLQCMKVKVESEKVGLKLNIQKTKIMASGPITSWEIDGETVKTVSDFILGGSKNLQMFKLVLEKAEETQIKLPTSAGSSKKQESSRKTSISALLTMPKPLTVWITINCGKFWRRHTHNIAKY